GRAIAAPSVGWARYRCPEGWGGVGGGTRDWVGVSSVGATGPQYYYHSVYIPYFSESRCATPLDSLKHGMHRMTHQPSPSIEQRCPASTSHMPAVSLLCPHYAYAQE